MPLQDVRNVTLLVDSLPHNHCIASNAYPRFCNHLPTDFECAASLACDTRCSHSARAEVLNAGCAVAVQQVPKGTGSQYFKLMIQGGLEASLSQQIVSTGRDSLICLPRKGGGFAGVKPNADRGAGTSFPTFNTYININSSSLLRCNDCIMGWLHTQSLCAGVYGIHGV